MRTREDALIGCREPGYAETATEAAFSERASAPAQSKMKILVAEDDAVTRRMLEVLCASWKFDVTAVGDGLAAAQALEGANAPPLALLDWMMPGLDGLEVVRRARAREPVQPVYIIMLTARGGREDVIRGLLAEADDYIAKPFDHRELRARVQAGARVVQLQIELAERVMELETVLSQVKSLHGLLPICSYCKRIRNDRNYWQRVESYIAERSEAEFTHGVCPQCYENIVKPELEHLRAG
ncbi:MAG: response regulator transcription factor [Terriglobia bacterium]